MQVYFEKKLRQWAFWREYGFDHNNLMIKKISEIYKIVPFNKKNAPHNFNNVIFIKSLHFILFSSYKVEVFLIPYFNSKCKCYKKKEYYV
jgi:hypothetical protein